MPIPITACTTAVLALLLIALASYVSHLRVNRRISLGAESDRELGRAVRAHANLAEFAPIFVLLLLALELGGAAPAALAVLAVLFVAARLAHAAGLLRRATSLPRQAGAAGSYLLTALAALWLLGITLI